METAPAQPCIPQCQEESWGQEHHGQTTPPVGRGGGGLWSSRTPCAATSLRREARDSSFHWPLSSAVTGYEYQAFEHGQLDTKLEKCVYSAGNEN